MTRDRLIALLGIAATGESKDRKHARRALAGQRVDQALLENHEGLILGVRIMQVLDERADP